MLDGVREGTSPILDVTLGLDAEEEEEDEEEDVWEERTLTHHPPLLATLLMSSSWRGRLERMRRRRQSLETSWR